MLDVIVLQSSGPVQPEWLRECLLSVRAWAGECGYAYDFVGDELFERVPNWYREKVHPATPIIADLARLLWVRSVLADTGHGIAVWIDADTFVIEPQELRVELQDTCQFGQERWLQLDAQGKPRVYRNVHNAWCAFRRGCPVLPFLIRTTQRLVKRIDARYIAPQFVGPKLLTGLHNIVDFEVNPACGAISPAHARALLDDDRGLLEYLERTAPGPLYAANLCASLNAESSKQALVERLRKRAF